MHLFQVLLYSSVIVSIFAQSTGNWTILTGSVMARLYGLDLTVKIGMEFLCEVRVPKAFSPHNVSCGNNSLLFLESNYSVALITPEFTTKEYSLEYGVASIRMSKNGTFKSRKEAEACMKQQRHHPTTTATSATPTSDDNNLLWLLVLLLLPVIAFIYCIKKKCKSKNQDPQYNADVKYNVIPEHETNGSAATPANGTVTPLSDTGSLQRAIELSPRLTREEPTEIVLMSGERSNRDIAPDFNARHPTRPPISHITDRKPLPKFCETGSVLDITKCGRKKLVTNEETSVADLDSLSKSPQRSTRCMPLEKGISPTSLGRILGLTNGTLTNSSDCSISPTVGQINALNLQNGQNKN